MTTVIQVDTAQPYQVRIGTDLLVRVGDLAPQAGTIAVIHPHVLTDRARHLQQLSDRPVVLIGVPDGEAAKSSRTLVECWDRLAEAGMTRSDVVVGLGGGATTDLAGFVAATWLRGVGYICVPTTVLGMADAAVGGKTGIDIASGKNLVGAFHEPLGVLCDLSLLEGLPAAEVRSGLAEIIKCGFIADPRILDLVEQDPLDAQEPAGVRFAELLQRAIQIKADTVSGDLREATSEGTRVGREALNYGHTLAHAIEVHDGFRWRHGEAVAIGMVFAAEVAHRQLGLDAGIVARHRDILTSVGLPTLYSDAEWPALRTAMSLDKKARGAVLRMVVLDGQVGRVRILAEPDERVLADCYSAIG